MAKTFIGVRVPAEFDHRLGELAGQTGKDKTSLVNEAIAQYLGLHYETVGDRLNRMDARLTAIETRMARLVGRLSSLGKLAA